MPPVWPGAVDDEDEGAEAETEAEEVLALEVASEEEEEGVPEEEEGREAVSDTEEDPVEPLVVVPAAAVEEEVAGDFGERKERTCQFRGRGNGTTMERTTYPGPSRRQRDEPYGGRIRPERAVDIF
jgi:hypothetical protein